MAIIIAIIMALVGLVGVAATLFSLPGVWLIIGSAAIIDLIQPEYFSLRTLLIGVGLGVLAEVAELVASGAGAKRAGGARRSAVGAIFGTIVGAIVGTPFMPIVGTIIGGVIGAGLGAAVMERTVVDRTWGDTMRVAQGAAVGRLVATVIKASFAFVIAVLFVVAALMT